MKQVTLNIKSRNELGGTAAKTLRQNGAIPAVIYGESGNQHLTLDAQEFTLAYRNFSGRAALLELKSTENDDSMYAIIQELQRDSCSDAFIHVDFKEIVRGKEMETDIPVETKGTADGVRNYGGVLEVSANTLSVRCRPRDLPEFIVIDVTELQIGKSIRLAEIEAPEGVTFLDDPETVIVGCVGATALTEDEGDQGDEGEEVAAAEETGAETSDSED